MFSFIKKIFRGEEKTLLTKETVKLSDLEAWFSNKQKTVLEDAKDRLDKFSQKIEEDTQKTKESITNLETVKLMNPNIPERAKHFMQGNRESFIKKANLLLESFKLPEEPKELPMFFEFSAKVFKDFLETTSRPYQILQEFFAHETRTVISNLNGLEGDVNELKELYYQLNINQLENFNGLITDFRSRLGKKQEQEEKLEKKRQELENLDKQKEELEKEEEELMKSDEHRKLKELQQTLIEIKKQIKQKEQLIINSFSPLEASFKKFRRMTLNFEQLAQEFLENPVHALTHDVELKVVEMLQSMKKMIEKDKIELKDKKKQKSIEAINKLTKDSLAGFLREYAEANVEQENLFAEIDANKARRRLQQVEEELDLLDKKIRAEQSVVELEQKELEKTNVYKVKDELIDMAKDVFSVELEISSQITE